MLDNELNAAPQASPVADLGRLVDVRVEVSVELGRTTMTLGDALELGPGAVIPLEHTAGAPLVLKVNDRIVARGEVLVIDDVYGLQLTEIITSDLSPAAGAITSIGDTVAADQLAA